MNYLLKEYKHVLVLDESINNGFFSGNKFRKLEYLIKKKDLKGIFTYGSPYSNHCLASAYYAKKVNVPAIILILTENKIELNKFPNINLAIRLGAKIINVKIESAFSDIGFYKEKFPEYLWIPGGGHTLEAFQTCKLFFKKLIYENSLINHIDWILLPFGTGTTALGILKAINEAKLNVKVIGISVSRGLERCKKSCYDFLEENELSKLEIITEYTGKYGEFSDLDYEYQMRFFKETGILVDPIYNIRSVRYFFENKLSNGLIINTGGTGNLYL